MSELSSPNNQSKSAIGGGVAGVSLGTALIALSPYITRDPTIAQYLQMVSPTVSVVGAYIAKIIFLQIQIQYNLWQSNRIEKKINSILQQPGISDTHHKNLIQKLENLQFNTIKLMEEGLLNTEINSSRLYNNRSKQN
jgi:hypothetical protein